ncbi:MAG TPA: translation initiation factor IF-3 [bacterium]|nr:translation initiation factor IF-3 [bacterium]
MSLWRGRASRCETTRFLRRVPIEEKQLRVNGAIRASEVRVISQDGKQLGVMLTRVALRKASDRNMDLVEVDPRAAPPVCKIMNYGKHKYETSKKSHTAKKSQARAQVKEVKFRPRTDLHDFDFKIKHITHFLDEGYKVKVSIWFRGREKLHIDLGGVLLKRVIDAVGDAASVTGEPRFEGRNLSTVLAPRRKRSPKNDEGQVAPNSQVVEGTEASNSQVVEGTEPSNSQVVEGTEASSVQ